MAPQFELQVVDGCIVVMRFQSAELMNPLLDPISDRVDGPIKNRQGHNFPRAELTPRELQQVLPKHLHKACRYVIACVKGNAQTLRHELCHARYFTSEEYRAHIDQVWSDVLTDKQRTYIAAFMTRLGYRPEVHVDEFQAYCLTEPPNFFGIDVSDAQEALEPLRRQLA